MIKVLSFLILLLPMAFAQANSSNKFFDLKSFKVEQLSEKEVLQIPDINLQTQTYLSDCSGENGNSPWSPNSVSLGDIVRIGKELWKIIDENKAVANVNSLSVSALPRGITCWDQLAEWRIPESKYYQVTYENAYGMEVINVIYRVTMSYGGSYESKGKYLANVSITPAKIDVFWGFNLSSTVKASHALNVGSAEDPIAGIELNIHWSVNALNHSEQSLSLFVDGTGEVSPL